ncbi:MAG TPA: glycosyltransferase, partial [Bacteroidales bacterium]|nr:glycosyltransferase [Bacteroidales bacterium]
MKILVLSSKVPFPPKDGGAIATLSLAEGLADVDNEVTMLCLNTSRHPFDVNKIPGVLKKKIRFLSVYHNTHINFIRLILNVLFSSEPYNATRFYSRAFERRMIDLLEESPSDIIQLEGPYMGYYIKAVRKVAPGTKIALRAHNVEHEIWQRKVINTRNPFLRFYFSILSRRIKKLEELVLKKCDYLVAISDRDRKQLLALKEIKNITIPTGLNPHRYPTPKEPEFPTLFYIGALDWMPNQEGITWFVENVFPLIRQQVPSISLHIAGRNAPAWLAHKLQSHKDGVMFHGEV